MMWRGLDAFVCGGFELRWGGGRVLQMGLGGFEMVVGCRIQMFWGWWVRGTVVDCFGH